MFPKLIFLIFAVFSLKVSEGTSDFRVWSDSLDILLKGILENGTIISQVSRGLSESRNMYEIVNRATILQRHIHEEATGPTNLENPLTKFLLIKYLVIDLPAITSINQDVIGSPCQDDLYYAATNISYISRVYSFKVQDLASGILLNRQFNIDFSADDCLEMVRQLNVAEEDDAARLWLTEAERRLQNGHIGQEDIKLLQEGIDNYKLHYNYEDHLIEMQDRYRHLCSGATQPEISQFQCMLELRDGLIPLKVEVLSEAPSIKIYHHVVDQEKRNQLIGLTEGQLYDAPVGLSNGDRTRSSARVASIMGYDDVDHPVVHYMKNITRSITGYSLVRAKELAAIKYETGGKFDLHYDFILEYGYIEEHRGNSFAEALTYLTDTELGGELIFPFVPLVIKPDAGSMVVWKDLDQNGHRDFRTLHGACPVLIGEKWIGTRNIREVGQQSVCSKNASIESAIPRGTYGDVHAQLELQVVWETNIPVIAQNNIKNKF